MRLLETTTLEAVLPGLGVGRLVVVGAMFTPLRPGDIAQIYSHLVFAANGSAVDSTIVDGQVLMRGRRLTTMDEQRILTEANAGFMRTLDRIRS